MAATLGGDRGLPRRGGLLLTPAPWSLCSLVPRHTDDVGEKPTRSARTRSWGRGRDGDGDGDGDGNRTGPGQYAGAMRWAFNSGYQFMGFLVLFTMAKQILGWSPVAIATLANTRPHPSLGAVMGVRGSDVLRGDHVHARAVRAPSRARVRRDHVRDVSAHYMRRDG